MLCNESKEGRGVVDWTEDNVTVLVLGVRASGVGKVEPRWVVRITGNLERTSGLRTTCHIVNILA